MTLEEKVLKIYNQRHESLKERKMAIFLKLVLVDNITDLDKILELTPITKKTLVKYCTQDDLTLRMFLPGEYEIFLNKINYIIDMEEKSKEREKIELIGNLLHDIFYTRYKLEEICSKYFITKNKFDKLFSDEEYIDSKFGKGVYAKIKERQEENKYLRSQTTGNMTLLKDEWDIKVAKDDILYLDPLRLRILSIASSYLLSGGNIEFVMNKYSIDNNLTVISILSDNDLKPILKPYFYNIITQYIEIEKILTGNDLSKKQKFIVDIVNILEKNNFNVQETIDQINISEYIFKKILLESLKYYYTSDDAKTNIKMILGIEEEIRKVK